MTEEETKAYPSGKIKFKSKLKNGLLDGLSLFFAENGKPLSETNYKEGRLEGECRYYYLENGALFSVQHFKQGLFDGKQEYFYPNGKPKTILHYKEGKIVGEVELFNA